jgi:hypothetical protein
MLYCNSTSVRCLTVGINTSLYAAGVVARYSIQVPVTATPGPVPIPLSGLVGATLEGLGSPLTPGSGYTLTVLRRSDLNGDGVVNVIDVQIVAKEAEDEQQLPPQPRLTIRTVMER